MWLYSFRSVNTDIKLESVCNQCLTFLCWFRFLWLFEDDAIIKFYRFDYGWLHCMPIYVNDHLGYLLFEIYFSCTREQSLQGSLNRRCFTSVLNNTRRERSNIPNYSKVIMSIRDICNLPCTKTRRILATWACFREHRIRTSFSASSSSHGSSKSTIFNATARPFSSAEYTRDPWDPQSKGDN